MAWWAVSRAEQDESELAEEAGNKSGAGPGAANK